MNNMGRRQLQIAGTEPETIAEIDEAAGAWLEVHEARKRLGEEEEEKQAALVAAMQNHKLTTYTVRGDQEMTVTLDEKVKAKVKRAKGDEGDTTEAE